MTKKQFVDQMRNCITQLEKGSYFFGNLPVGHIFGNKNYGEIKIFQGTGLGCGDSRAMEADDWCGR